MKAYRPNYSAVADLALMVLFGFLGGVVFLIGVNAFRWYVLGIREMWWPNSTTDSRDHRAFITVIFGAAPAWALLRFWLYRRWKWPPYSK